MAGPNYPIGGTIASPSGTDLTLVGGRNASGLATPLAISPGGCGQPGRSRKASSPSPPAHNRR